MKTVIDCMSGVCMHPEHKVNALLWLIPVVGVVLACVYYKYKYGEKKDNN